MLKTKTLEGEKLRDKCNLVFNFLIGTHNLSSKGAKALNNNKPFDSAQKTLVSINLVLLKNHGEK